MKILIILFILNSHCCISQDGINEKDTIKEYSIENFDIDSIVYLSDVYIDSIYTYSNYYSINGEKKKCFRMINSFVEHDMKGATIQDYFNDNMSWPENFDGTGAVFLVVLFNTKNLIIEVRVLKGVCPKCNIEAVKLVNELQKEHPLIYDSKGVSFIKYYSVKF